MFPEDTAGSPDEARAGGGLQPQGPGCEGAVGLRTLLSGGQGARAKRAPNSNQARGAEQTQQVWGGGTAVRPRQPFLGECEAGPGTPAVTPLQPKGASSPFLKPFFFF